MRRVTSVDVARDAGVAQSTVSRALSDDKRISKETRKKVQQAALRLGYTPNKIAQTLQTNKSNVVGLIMADMMNPFYPAVLELLTQRIHSIGKQLMLLSVPTNATVDDVLPSMLQYQIDGLIVTSATLSSKMRSMLTNHNTPVVLFNRSVDDLSVNSVCCENGKASTLLAFMLIQAKHRAIALIGGRADTSTHRERRGAFLSELERLGYALVGEEIGGNTYEGGYRSAMRLLSAPQRPDAIFCLSDVMALGALDAARFGLGLSVPDDVSIVGFDDIPAAAWPAYDLTTVQQPIEEMVAQALALIFEPQDNTPTAIRIPGQLTLRRSLRLEPRDSHRFEAPGRTVVGALQDR